MEDRGPNELAREQSHDQRNDASPHGYLDLSRFCSGRVLMLGGPLFEGHG